MANVVVITGASKGLGLATVKEFAANGWQVVGTGRSERPADFPEAAAYRQFDAGDAAACQAFWQWAQGEFAADKAKVCLINNAGGYVSGGLTQTTAEDYEQQMRANFFAAVHMTRGFAAAFDTARIVNVVSSSALRAHKNNSAYGASKAAAAHFFQSLQAEFSSSKYQITNLYPSNIATHGAAANAIAAGDLAAFVRELAENQRSYYLPEVSLAPSQPEKIAG